jgi:hypothetical protein
VEEIFDLSQEILPSSKLPTDFLNHHRKRPNLNRTK